MGPHFFDQRGSGVRGLAADHLAEGVVVDAVLLREGANLGVRAPPKGAADLRDNVHTLTRSVPHSVTDATPHLVRYTCYARGMRKASAAEVIKDNVLRLLRHYDGLPADGVGIQALRRRA